jgi:hypothetical protein
MMVRIYVYTKTSTARHQAHLMAFMTGFGVQFTSAYSKAANLCMARPRKILPVFNTKL